MVTAVTTLHAARCLHTPQQHLRKPLRVHSTTNSTTQALIFTHKEHLLYLEECTLIVYLTKPETAVSIYMLHLATKIPSLPSHTYATWQHQAPKLVSKYKPKTLCA
jgi:hypothetical protein